MNVPRVLEKFQPQTGLILGSGLGTFVDKLSIVERIPFSKAGLPETEVRGHAGEVVLGTMGNARLAVLSGRVHLYEGRSATEVVAGVWLLFGARISRLIITNAAGTLNPAFPPGQWMMLTDHLNLTGQSPLAGETDCSDGPPFIDMSGVYSVRLREKFASIAAERGMPLHQGVYAGVCGPQYETPAEVRMLRTIGADAVGMSTVLEAIQAHAFGLEIAAFSCLTNWAAGIAGPLNHSEVIATGREAAVSFAELLEKTLVQSL